MKIKIIALSLLVQAATFCSNQPANSSNAAAPAASSMVPINNANPDVVLMPSMVAYFRCPAGYLRHPFTGQAIDETTGQPLATEPTVNPIDEERRQWDFINTIARRVAAHFGVSCETPCHMRDDELIFQKDRRPGFARCHVELAVIAAIRCEAVDPETATPEEILKKGIEALKLARE